MPSCQQATCLPLLLLLLLLQQEQSFAWDRINWLNPTIAKDDKELPAGATICVHNGPTPAGVVLEKEPGELHGLCVLCCAVPLCRAVLVHALIQAACQQPRDLTRWVPLLSNDCSAAQLAASLG
jgi:hypothetical protein